MWKRPAEPEHPTPQEPLVSKPATPASPLRERAIIGASILIKGDLTGEEDLMVQGQVEGKIHLKQYNVTVGEQGRVKADIYARIVSVEGRVEGNLFGEEKIIIRKSGVVKGNLLAPRVSLEEGCSFKGSIDMAEKTAPVERPTARTNEAKQEQKQEEAKPASSSTPQKMSLGLTANQAPPSGR